MSIDRDFSRSSEQSAVNIGTFVKFFFLSFSLLPIVCKLCNPPYTRFVRFAITTESFTLIWCRDKCSLFAKQSDTLHIRSVPNTWTHTINKRSHELSPETLSFRYCSAFSEQKNTAIVWFYEWRCRYCCNGSRCRRIPYKRAS